MKAPDKTLVNMDMFRKTHSVSEAERYQRILEWKIEVQIVFIEKGRINDAADLLRATIIHARNIDERKRAIYKAKEIIEGVANRGHADDADCLRQILQDYLD